MTEIPTPSSKRRADEREMDDTWHLVEGVSMRSMKESKLLAENATTEEFNAKMTEFYVRMTEYYANMRYGQPENAKIATIIAKRRSELAQLHKDRQIRLAAFNADMEGFVKRRFRLPKDAKAAEINAKMAAAEIDVERHFRMRENAMIAEINANMVNRVLLISGSVTKKFKVKFEVEDDRVVQNSGGRSRVEEVRRRIRTRGTGVPGGSVVLCY